MPTIARGVIFLSRFSLASAVGALVIFFVIEIVAIGTSNLDDFFDDLPFPNNGRSFFR